MKNQFLFLALAILSYECNIGKEVRQNPKVEPTDIINPCNEAIDSFLSKYWAIPQEYVVYDGYRLLSDSVLLEIQKIDSCLIGKKQSLIFDKFGKPAVVYDRGTVQYILINPATFERKDLLFRVDNQIISKIELAIPERID